jgi:mannose-6-phosphate isomerase-like protein (cupin superfamily)
MGSPDEVVNLDAKLALVDEHWAPKIVGQLNDLHLKVVKLEGEFVWHAHDDTDELFVVLDGHLRIELEHRDDVELDAGEFYVVPRGARHRPVAEGECSVLLLEPAGTVNTGDAGGDRTRDPEWL